MVNLLIKIHLEFLSLKGGCTGLSVSTLVKMPHCWKAHATAQISITVNTYHAYTDTVDSLYNTPYNMGLVITWSYVAPKFFYHGILQRNYRSFVPLYHDSHKHTP